MKYDEALQEDTLIRFEENKVPSKKGPKPKPIIQVDLDALIFDITDNYEGKDENIEIAKVLYDCLGGEEFFLNSRKKCCGCCSCKERY